MKKILIAAIFASSPMLTNADSHRATGTLQINPMGEGTFEVIYGGGQGPLGIWCAASDYVLRQNSNARGRLYVQTPRGPSITVPGRTGVVFTTKPSEQLLDTPAAYTVSVDRAGENLLLQHAHVFCRNSEYERETEIESPTGGSNEIPNGTTDGPSIE